MEAANRSTEAAAAITLLQREAPDAGIDLSTGSITRFRAYLDTLLRWQRRLSLTAANTPTLIVQRHIVDSLFVARHLKPGMRLADIGSGAGFPGIPLAIVCPDASIVLIESRRKRANFLREVARNACLGNVKILEQRAEAITGPPDFDIVISRALGSMAEFLRLSGPLLPTGGLAIAMKGPRGLQEPTGPRPPLLFAKPEVFRYTLHGGVGRMLLVCRRL